MNPKKKSVGIQLLSKDQNGELVAILKVRSKWNAEKNAPESWPGACQVTAHGKLEAGEDFMQALLREVGEELGEKLVPVIKKLSENDNLKELVNLETNEKHVITYGAVIEPDVFNMLLNKEKTDSFGGFKIIKQSNIEKIVDLKKLNRETGVTDENVIAMFPDAKEAIQIAFEKLS